MPRKRFLLAPACALALVICVPGRSQDPSPSLGDIARQAQKDKDNKDKANKPVAKVFTNDDMPSGSGGLAAALGGGSGRIAQPGAAGGAAGIQSPSEGLDKMRAMVEELATLDRTTLASNVLGGKAPKFPGSAEWEEKLFAAKQVFVAQCRDVFQKATQLAASAESIKDIQDPNDPRAKSLASKLQPLVQEAQQASASFQAVIQEGKDLAAQAPAH